MIETWKEICYLVNSNTTASESKFQSEIVHLFEKLGWKKYKQEIEEQRTITVGSAKNLKPDIIIKADNKDLFVVELKKPSATYNSRNDLQLFSYMRQLKLDIGILLNDKIHVFFEDGKIGNPIEILTVEFDENETVKGLQFIELFSKETFNEETLKSFYINKLLKSDALNMVISTEYKALLLEYIRRDVETKFNTEVSNFVVSKIKLSVLNNSDDVKLTACKANSSDNKATKHNVETEESEIEKVKGKIPRWLNKPSQTNHRILVNAMKYLYTNEIVSYRTLMSDCHGIANFDTNFYAMANIGDKNHGKVFDRSGDNVSLWLPVKNFVRESYALKYDLK
jgi:hypothetical protein